MGQVLTFPPPVPKLIDKHAVAAICTISWRSVYRMADAGILPYGVKLGGRRLWNEAALRQWIADGCPKSKAPGAKGGAA